MENMLKDMPNSYPDNLLYMVMTRDKIWVNRPIRLNPSHLDYCIRRLDEKTKRVIILKFKAMMTDREIADILKMRQGKVIEITKAGIDNIKYLGRKHRELEEQRIKRGMNQQNPPIGVLDLPEGLKTILKRAGIGNVYDLTNLTEDNLKSIKYIGDIKVNQIKQALNMHGLKLLQ